jgi:hypothetical protein
VTSSWNSVQIVTLIVDSLTPLAVAMIGLVVARAGRRLEAVQWTNQTVVEYRLKIFEDVAPMINQLLCFGTFVGTWKEITPQKVTAIKRQVDETMYSNRLLFSNELFDAYRKFMLVMFSMYASKDADALVRAPIDSKWGNRRHQGWWEDSMNKLFTVGEQGSSLAQIQNAYDELARQFRADLYVTNMGRPILMNIAD